MAAHRAGKLLFGIVLLGAVALGGCRESAGKGDYFEISGRLFSFNYRVATAVYIVTLRPLKPIQQGQVAVATFENPAGGEPIVVEQKVWANLDKVTIESPPLECVVKDRPYSASIVISGPDGQQLQALETTITSDLDQSVLPDRPLVIGPVYELNPELAGHPDGRLPQGRGVTCPK
ncbi:hypothetical protein [Arvimicrobium flavum]|uniref:hypothetical protein n=1 Tax=Arvimicrobium flavum TaxID=3393320 RepID=UPI00237A5AC6|nr:hypothetical protein [Mesorhizobium shangrilense]